LSFSSRWERSPNPPQLFSSPADSPVTQQQGGGAMSEGREEATGYWDTDYRPTSERALCNVLELVIRAERGLLKGYHVRRFRRYVEDGMMPGAAASEAAPDIMPLALALQELALRTGRESPLPLTDEQERVMETLARQVFEEIDRLEREASVFGESELR